MANEKLINLSKKVKINLAKVTKLKICAQVGLLDDVSGSAETMHKNGIIQRLFDRLFAVAFEFDDNGVLDAWAFDTESIELEPITEALFGNYVQKYIIAAHRSSIWGGTCYAPGMQDVIDHYYPVGHAAVNVAAAAVHEVAEAAGGLFGKVKSLFGGKPAPAAAPAAKSVFSPKSAAIKLADPAYIMVVTDGENSDKSATQALLEANKDKQIFWQFIGVSQPEYRTNFGFIEKLSQTYPNVGFYDAGAIDNVADDTLYSALFTPKFVQWYEKAKAL